MGDWRHFGERLESGPPSGGLRARERRLARVPRPFRSPGPIPTAPVPDALARVVEAEILPRLMLAHRPRRPARRVQGEPRPEPARRSPAFSALLLAARTGGPRRPGGRPARWRPSAGAPSPRPARPGGPASRGPVGGGCLRFPGRHRGARAAPGDEPPPLRRAGERIGPGERAQRAPAALPRRDPPVRPVDRRELLPGGGLGRDHGGAGARPRSPGPASAPTGSTLSACRCPATSLLPALAATVSDVRRAVPQSGDPRSGRRPLFRPHTAARRASSGRMPVRRTRVSHPPPRKLCWTDRHWPAERVSTRTSHCGDRDTPASPHPAAAARGPAAGGRPPRRRGGRADRRGLRGRVAGDRCRRGDPGRDRRNRPRGREHPGLAGPALDRHRHGGEPAEGRCPAARCPGRGHHPLAPGQPPLPQRHRPADPLRLDPPGRGRPDPGARARHAGGGGPAAPADGDPAGAGAGLRPPARRRDPLPAAVPDLRRAGAGGRCRDAAGRARPTRPPPACSGAPPSASPGRTWSTCSTPPAPGPWRRSSPPCGRPGRPAEIRAALPHGRGEVTVVGLAVPRRGRRQRR